MKAILLLFVIFMSNIASASPGNQHISLFIKAFDSKSLNKRILAINLFNEGKWHTYWKNPGDSGLPIQNKFSVGQKEVRLKEIVWPAPQKIISEGDIHTYGYEGEYTLFYEIPNWIKKLKINSKILVCDNICIPAVFYLDIDLSKDFSVGKNPKKLTSEQLEVKLAKLPQVNKDLPIEFILVKGEKENTFKLHTLLRQSIKLDKKHENLVFPYPAQPLNWAHESVQSSDDLQHSLIDIEWDGEFMEPQMAFPISNDFEKPIPARFLVKTVQGYSLVEKKFTSYLDELPAEILAQASVSSPSPSKSIWLLLLLALVGGFILNFMPCVLPVISLKIFKLLEQADESKTKVRRHNLFYSLGVISSLIALAVVVHILKASGQTIGWGFQLQSPTFVFLLSTLLFIMVLNLFGLFEFRTPFSQSVGTAQVKDNYWGDFFSGILTTILSTPCSAPFLGGAVGFAFTSSIFNIYFIFLFIGIGLALPFLLSALYPKLLSFLPKPGQWMNTLKYLLGFAMLLTFIWLYDIFASLVDFSTYGVLFNVFLALVFVAIFFYQKIKSQWRISALILPILMMAYLFSITAFDLSYSKDQSSSKSTSSLQWSDWSNQELKKLKKERRWVFMDFTAKWCLTCKVNKKLVLDTDDFEELSKEKNIKLLRADWTHRDEAITKWLNRFNLAGVPAYFIQKPDGKIIYLGETISISEIRKNAQVDP